MAFRNILTEVDPILNKKSREVEAFDDKLASLLDDMAETMYKAKGVGIAAPQIGLLRRIITIDDGKGLIELINPEIIEFSGKYECEEGCLSIPGFYAVTLRPKFIKVKALNRFGEEKFYEGTDYKAAIFSHEIDHLDGILFRERIIKK